MRVLLLIDSLSSGGAQNQIVNLAIGLAKIGHEVDLCYYHDINFFSYKLKDVLGINCILIEKQSKAGIGVIRSIRKRLLTENYNVAISYLETPNLYLTLASLFVRRNVQIITSERNATNPKLYSLLFRKWLSHTIANKLVCNSFHEAAFWKAKLWDKNKVLTIYNGTDLARFSFLSKRQFKNFKIVCIASAIPRKNVVFVIEALKLLRDKYSINLNLIWCGQNKFENGYSEYVDQCKTLVVKYGLENNWKWVDPQKDVVPLHMAADALLLASYKEGVPNVICEALSTGIPVIASNILDNPHLLLGGEAGFLFDLDSPLNLATKLKEFYTLPDLEIMKIVDRGRQYAESNISMDKFLRSYESLISSNS